MSRELGIAFDAGKFSDLQCYVLPCSRLRCMPECIQACDAAYLFWKVITEEGLLSEDKKNYMKTLQSDVYLQHKEAICLFDRNRPVGLMLFDWLDLLSPATLDSNISKIYSPHAIDSVIKQGYNVVMAPGNLRVHPDWRKSKIGPGISELMMSFMIKRFLISDAKATIIVTRRSRHMDNLGKAYGAEMLEANREYCETVSDVMLIKRETVCESSYQEIQSLATELWSTRINAFAKGESDEKNI